MPPLAAAEIAAHPALAQPIDRAHLARMTFGDRSLQREVLQLFERQSALLVSRMRSGDRAAVPALAHTLKGSAAGVGAWKVSSAAEAVELAADDDGRGDAIMHLAACVDEARASIVDLM